MVHHSSSQPGITVEVCVESLQSAIISEKAAADRIELNSAIALGGLTPSLNQLQQIKSRLSLPVICMVRPRPGNFFYSQDEFELMLADAKLLLEQDADGLAVGMLDAVGNVDKQRLFIVRELCGEKELVFHRALDCTPDINFAMREIIDAGVDRVLTSGGKPTAEQGKEKLAQLHTNFSDQIEIIVGSGISSSNARDLAIETNCNQIHGTFSSVVETPCSFVPEINFNQSLGLQPNQLRESSFDEIVQTIANLCQL